MKRNLTTLVVMLGVLMIGLHAYAKRNTNQNEGYQTATVVSVDRHVEPSTYVGDTPTDAPLQAEDYSYDIGIRLACDVYVGRYQSATNYLPSAFARNNTVDVRLQKHVMYVSLPDDDREVKMGIVGHRRMKDQSCEANS